MKKPMKDAPRLDKLAIKVSQWLPRRLCYWVYIRVHNNAWAELGNVAPDEITCFNAMETWASNKGSY